MMMMPFFRLIAIYAIVGAAIFAFIKRDQVAEYFATPAPAAITPSAKAAPEASPTVPLDAPVEASATVPPAPETAAPETAASAQSTTTYSAPPAFGTQITPQYFGQTATPAAPSGETMVERWTKARQVFSQGNPAEAGKLYEKLTTDFPENADLHGETGNLYYNLGQFNKAATHYLAVGKIAVNAGNMQMAGSMLALLQRIAPAKAAELQATLNGR